MPIEDAGDSRARRALSIGLGSGLDSPGGSVKVAHGSCLLPIAAGSASVPFLTPEAAMGSLHQPVLVNEIVAWLTPQEGTSSIIVDGTAGGGGHTVALARRLGAGGRVDRAGPRPGDAGPGRKGG